MVDDHQAPKKLRIEPQIVFVEILSGLGFSILSIGIRAIVGFTHVSLFFSAFIGVILVGVGLYNTIKSDELTAVFIYIIFAFLFSLGICGVILLEVIAGETLTNFI